jgi:flagellin
MAMRINHNVPALNALRNLNKTDAEMSQSLERLSSGQKVNRAADGPAALVISEQMRGQIASVKQAIQNSEASISMVQTAEASMNEVNNLLVSMRQLAIHAANEGANDRKMVEADQAEVENALDTVDRIARTSQFGTRTLLDGSNGANGVAVGDGLQFVSASPNTKSSPAQGYEVNITRAATRAEKSGTRQIELEDLWDAEKQSPKDFNIQVSEGGKSIGFSLVNKTDGEAVTKMLENLARTPEQFDKAQAIKDIRKIIAQTLQRKADEGALDVQVYLSNKPGAVFPLQNQALTVQHKQFGSSHTFLVSSSAENILGKKAGAFEGATPGRDVEGTVDGKIGVGKGEELNGAPNTATEGLVLRFASVKPLTVKVAKADAKPLEEMQPSGDIPAGSRAVARKELTDGVEYTWEVPIDVKKDVEGYAHVSQNSLTFQVGPTRGQQVKVSLLDAKTDRLGTGIKNDSGFRSLREINVTSSQGAQDAIKLIDDAISSVSSVRANLGAFQKNTLQSNTNSLRVAHENLTSAESSLRDADMAEEMSTFTRNQIMLSSGVAMLAQANQTPQAVLQLLSNRAA